ncbi:integrase catalytic domain-containing protein [Trichonephila inaurata madagascariensis]|uniref:Integrase catalytic domain-containing protein n=1 Tax=Trichonephila inaurata madagascariensis TaxID=2747483 RepID=A0A8X6XJH5_9ARAC|nr:integrase catalytic domain-containing protein [Trichonephila inaurata madagascariensis]
MDGGSQTSFVDASIDKLKLSDVSSEKINIHTFESSTLSQAMRRTNQLQRDGSFAELLAFTTLWDHLQSLKKLFQDAWVLDITWDELLPSNLATLEYTAVKELDNIYSIQIPRFIGISSHIPFAVHVFCDVSERTYGSVLYIVTVKGDQSNVHLVYSRNRLAPIRKVTLPRLEL